MHQGQIIEIPATSPIYQRLDQMKFDSKADELREVAKKFHYTLYDGILLDGHYGIENFELCQRKGLTKGGHPQPLYVISIDQETKRVYVGAGKNHPGLYTKALLLNPKSLHWKTSNEPTEFPIQCEVELSNEGHNTKHKATLYYINGEFYIEFEEKIACFFRNKELMVFKNDEPIATYYINN